MEKALDLLKKDLIVRECAFELGYADEFYFSRDFKKYYGISPSVMKQELMRKNRTVPQFSVSAERRLRKNPANR